ncbi:hypothetical protein YC2023_058861 [Brassica napus]
MIKHSHDFLFFSMTEFGICTHASPDGNWKAVPFLCRGLPVPLKRLDQRSVAGEPGSSKVTGATTLVAFTGTVDSAGKSEALVVLTVLASRFDCLGVVTEVTVTEARFSDSAGPLRSEEASTVGDACAERAPDAGESSHEGAHLS